MRGLVIAATLAACGRVDFGARGDATGGGGTGSDGAPANGCAAHDYELCDGFEATTFAPYWKVADSNITLDTTMAHRGTTSVHVHAPAVEVGTGQYIAISQTTTLPLGDPVFYVRAWIWLSSMPANNMELIAAEQVGPVQNEDALFARSTDLSVYAQFDNASQDNNTLPPLGSWFCVLWTVTRSTTSGSVELGGDPPAAMLAHVATDGMPALERMYFGTNFADPSVNNPQPALDVLIDDVIVDKSPVTCAD